MEAINILEVYLNQERVGRLAQTPQHLCAFEYDSGFLQSGFSISPFYLPLQPGLMVARATPFSGNFGVFDDSLPDGWGSILLHRYLLSQGIDVTHLTVLQRLALVGTTARGALEYFPDHSVRSSSAGISDFNDLASEVESILTSQYSEGENVDKLYEMGGSSGGARPKVFARIGDKEWLVKFRSSSDPAEVGVMEYEYSLIAKECGIEIPETRLFQHRYFGVERFDRTTSGKIHTVSAAGLLQADFRIPSLDYAALLQLCLQLTRNMEVVSAMFRRMVFNVVISNRDDHAKNFSFQYVGGAWKLSPAYDLLPSAGFNGFHTTTVNRQGNPTLNDIIQVGLIVGLKKRQMEIIIEQVIEVCRNSNKLNYKL